MLKVYSLMVVFSLQVIEHICYWYPESDLAKNEKFKGPLIIR